MNLDTIILNEGLPNNGNTCFLNSAIQSLYGIDSFRTYILNQLNQRGPPQKTQIFTELIKNIFISISQGRQYEQRKQLMKNLVNYFTQSNFNYKGYSQQDSSQFLLLILQNLFEQNPDIETTFQLYYKNVCCVCGKSTKIKEFVMSKFESICSNDNCQSEVSIMFISKPNSIIYCGNAITDQSLSFNHISGDSLIFSLKSSILYSGNGKSGHYVCKRRLTQDKQIFKIFNDSYVQCASKAQYFEPKIQIFELIPKLDISTNSKVAEECTPNDNSEASIVQSSKKTTKLRFLVDLITKSCCKLMPEWFINGVSKFGENAFKFYRLIYA